MPMDDDRFEGEAQVAGTKFSARGRGVFGVIAGLIALNIVAIVIVSFLASSPNSSSALWLTNGFLCGSVISLTSLLVRAMIIQEVERS